jgi:hypothetical protein
LDSTTLKIYFSTVSRLAYVNFLTNLEADFNVSKLAVTNIGQEIISISEKIHRYNIQKLEKRLCE